MLLHDARRAARVDASGRWAALDAQDRAGMALLAAGSLLLTQVSVGGSYLGDIVLGLLVFGLGIGPAFATATIAALAGVSERESGVASGLSNTAFQIGGALGVAIVSTIAVSRSEDFLLVRARGAAASPARLSSSVCATCGG